MLKKDFRYSTIVLCMFLYKYFMLKVLTILKRIDNYV